MLTTICAAIVIGLLLGLLGGGGSILTVPMLVYFLHIEPKVAIVTSFIVVGLSSMIALIPHARRQSVCWKSGIYFGLSGMLGAFSGGRIAGHFSNDLLMSLFGTVCLIIGLLMLKPSKKPVAKAKTKTATALCPIKVPYFRVLFDGFFVGLFTGMVGVGGGFVIVPALSFLVGLPLPGAVGTSLLIIVLNAFAGLAGYSTHVSIDVHLTMVVAIGTIVGSAFGAWLSGYVNPKLLSKLFGFMVVLLAIYILYQAMTEQLILNFLVWLATPNATDQFLLSFTATVVVLIIGIWIHKKNKVVFSKSH